MKTLLCALVVFLGVVAVAPQAEARSRYGRYYDDCDRPYYGYRSVRYYPVRAYRYYRPSYYRPVRAYYSDYDYCAPRVRYYASRPRFSFFFGF
jgi:hypothetical protein